MPYQYHGAEPDPEFNATTRPKAQPPTKPGNDRLREAVLEIYKHKNPHTVVAISRTGRAMTVDTARRLQAIAKAMPMGLTREQLLAIGGYRTVDAFQTQCAVHGLTKLREAFMARPFARKPRSRTFRTEPTRLTRKTTDRFNMVEALLTYAPDLTREELMRRAGWNLDAFAKATRRHNRRDLWDRATNLPRDPHPAGNKGNRPGPKGPTGPRTTTNQRFEDLEHILKDPRTSREEALQRVGWAFVSFERACYRHDRTDILAAYLRHGAAA